MCKRLAKCSLYCLRCYAFMCEIYRYTLNLTTEYVHLLAKDGLPITLDTLTACDPESYMYCFCSSCHYFVGYVSSKHGGDENNEIIINLKKTKFSTKPFVDR